MARRPYFVKSKGKISSRKRILPFDFTQVKSLTLICDVISERLLIFSQVYMNVYDDDHSFSKVSVHADLAINTALFFDVILNREMS